MEPKIIKKSDCTFSHIIMFSVFFLTFLSGYSQVGIGTTDPKSTLEVNGSMAQTVTTVTGNTTLDISYSIVVCDNGAAAITITLPTPVGIKGRIYTIKRNSTSSANVTIAGTINGATNLILTASGQSETLFSDNVEWKSLSKYEASSSTGWSLTGNASTTAGTNFIGTTDAKDFVVKTNNTEKMRILSDGNVGIGVAVPTATLQLKAGTTAAGTAPLKLTDGPLLTAVEPGAIEYKGHTFYATTYLVRRSVMLAQDVVMARTEVTNTTTETTVYTATMAANYLTAGKMINIKLYGSYKTDGTGNLFTVRVKLAGTTILTTTSVSVNTGGNYRPIDFDIRSTIRSIGASGTIISYGKVQQDIQAANMDISGVTTIDTTVLNTLTVTIQWGSADSNNGLRLEGGATECVDQNN